MITHPVYTKYQIFEGSKGDLPRPGAFYAAKKGDSLSAIASKAYGSVNWALIQRINKNSFNLSNLVYRKNSSSCSSKMVTSADVLKMSSYSSTAQGWIALCPGDRDDIALRISASYPVLWIPQNDGDVPLKSAAIKPGRLFDMVKRGLEPADIIDKPVYTPEPSGPVVTPDGYVPPTYPTTPTAPSAVVPAQAGMNPWLIGLLAAAGLGAIVWAIVKE